MRLRFELEPRWNSEGEARRKKILAKMRSSAQRTLTSETTILRGLVAHPIAPRILFQFSSGQAAESDIPHSELRISHSGYQGRGPWLVRRHSS